MGCLKIAGRHVGSTDHADVDVPGCFASKKQRRMFGCDGSPFRKRIVAFDAENPGGREIDPSDVTAEVDSAYASKVIGALAEKLEPDEMSRILNILREADLISHEESKAVSEALNGTGEETEPLAADGAFYERYPDAARLRPSYDVTYPRAPRRVPAPTAAQDKAFHERFPDAARIKVL